MKIPTFFALVLGLSSSVFAEVNTPNEAWIYLTAPSQSSQWIIIETKNGKAYVQCENIKTHILCPFPVWAKIVPQDGDIKPINSRDIPFPEVVGSKLKAYLSPKQLSSLKKELVHLGVPFKDIYSQSVDRKGRIVGTSYDVRVLLGMEQKNFDRFVKGTLSALDETASSDSYNYKAGSWW